MYHIKNDQRSIHSSEMIYEGLSRLMRAKDFIDITVTDLVEEAKVGRTTFYRNFDAIEDILHMRSDQIFMGLKEYIQNYRKKIKFEKNFDILKPILRYFYLNSEIIELLILAHSTDIFYQSFKELLKPYKPKLESLYSVEEEYVEYLISINTGFLTNILMHWVNTGKKQAPDELADKIKMMINSGTSPWASI